MRKLLYVIKFCPKSQICDNKSDRYFYNIKKANLLLDSYRDNEYHFVSLHTIQPED